MSRARGTAAAARRETAPARAAAKDPGAASGRDDRRKQILKAAVKVFAEKGYHGCRISDVAEEAGVAYGLVYHYYGNKDGLLASVFDTNWAFFAKAVDEIAESGATMRDKLSHIVELAFQAFEMAPLVVKVLVLEFGRNARLGEALDNPQVARVFKSITRIFEDGKKTRELYEGIDPSAMSILFIGALETAFVSFVLTNQGTRSKVQSAVTLDTMKKTLIAMLHRGALGGGHAHGL
ncbi:MAG: TetR/AcrR family transcriptional regulator [Deltaproteobacteria bacterium]|nr:TetR/AcrR family transcriptional regulator [Deltaproteobacteria bacterium]